MQMMTDAMDDVRAACQTALDYCVECLHQCESCPNKADDVHQACIATCKKCVEACSVCVHDCAGAEVDMAQMKASMRICMDICAACVKDCQACANACATCKPACTVCADACQLCGTVCSQQTGTDQGMRQADQKQMNILQGRFSAARAPALRSETGRQMPVNGQNARRGASVITFSFSNKEISMAPNLKPYYDAAVAADQEVKRILAEMDAAFNSGTEEGEQKALEMRPALDAARTKSQQANQLYISMRDASLVDDKLGALFTLPPDPAQSNTQEGAPMSMSLKQYKSLAPRERLAFAKRGGQFIEEEN